MAGAPVGPAQEALEAETTEMTRPPGEVWYSDIEPIINQSCVKCHSDGSILGAPPEGLRHSSYETVIAGGDRLALVPGNAGASKVWRHVAGIETPRMPFDGPPFLEDNQIVLIERWIDGGARDAEGNPASSVASALI